MFPLILQFLFGILLLGHLPSLEPYAGYTPLRNEALTDDTAYEPLASGENICPERHVDILSSKSSKSLKHLYKIAKWELVL
jgi:ATP-binding cassette, subfamily C (CFTR/MRP), member 1